MTAVLIYLLSWICVCQAYPKSSLEKKKWPGWSGVENLFVFGDSYSTTGFEANLTQPSLNNPLGNPTYPGYTSSNGPNWVDFLTTTYNASALLTYNLAYGGATVDSALVKPYEDTVLSLKDQVQQLFLPNYAPSPQDNGTLWSPGNTLFAFFIGVNDVGDTYQDKNSTLISQIFKTYSGLINQVYDSGARNFLFLKVAPVQRAPLTSEAAASDPGLTQLEANAIMDWNNRLRQQVDNLTSEHDDATAFLFDTFTTFSKVLDDPTVFEQTKGYKNLTNYCEKYENGTSSWYTFDKSCGVPVNEYFWLNTLHPTFPMHNATAARIAKMLTRRLPSPELVRSDDTSEVASGGFRKREIRRGRTSRL